MTEMQKRDRAHEWLTQYAIVQDRAADTAHVLPCPRCGRYTMKTRLYTNASSREHDNCYVCDECGTQESLVAASMAEPLALDEWAMPKAFYAENPREEGEDDAEEDLDVSAD